MKCDQYNYQGVHIRTSSHSAILIFKLDLAVLHDLFPQLQHFQFLSSLRVRTDSTQPDYEQTPQNTCRSLASGIKPSTLYPLRSHRQYGDTNATKQNILSNAYKIRGLCKFTIRVQTNNGTLMKSFSHIYIYKVVQI